MTEQPPSGAQPEYPGEPSQPTPDAYAGYPGARNLDPNDPLVAADYGGWWARGTALARKTWKHVLILQIAFVVLELILITPVHIWQASLAVVPGSIAPGQNPNDVLAQSLGRQVGPILLSLVAGVLTQVIAAIIGLVVVHLMVMAATNEQLDIGVAFQRASRRLGIIVLWSVIFGLLATIGFVLCVLPGFYVALVGMLLAPVVAFERGNPLGQAFTLYNRNFGLALGLTLTVVACGLVAGIVAGCFGGALTIGSAVTGSTGAYILSAVITVLISAVLTAAVQLLTYPLTTVAYATLRARLEPLSTAQLATEIAR
ncbi:hypothetical protein GCM10009765_59640 [Fodinicola feengrottensis]|uniref:Glycerophosphoryl diester phosphodiesterase membrane domain-containing protein n=1 Tax=Fodinicola feengrottensis TaxID=435914 RepID=A0ABN2IC87_9ACTN